MSSVANDIPDLVQFNNVNGFKPGKFVHLKHLDGIVDKYVGLKNKHEGSCIIEAGCSSMVFLLMSDE